MKALNWRNRCLVMENKKAWKKARWKKAFRRLCIRHGVKPVRDKRNK